MNTMTPVDLCEEDAAPVAIDFLLGKDGRTHTDRQVFKIGDLAREFGVTLRTLRFYEDRGLLAPERRGTTRLYSRRDRARLRLILLAKTLGFSLTEAKQIIDLYHQPNGRRRQLEVAVQRFAEQEEVLVQQKREIDAAIEAMKTSIVFLHERLRALDGEERDAG